jgi:integrase
MLQSLKVVAGWLNPNANPMSFPWGALRRSHLLAIRAHLAECYAPASSNKMLCAVRGCVREAWRLGQIPENDFRQAIDVKGIRGESLASGRALSMGEISALLGACGADPSPAGTRDGALLAILFGTGVRRGEVVGLDLADFDPQTGQLKVRKGKGRKDRIVYCENSGGAWLKKWISIRGEEPGPLLLPIAKDGAVGTRRLSTQAIYSTLQKRAAQAGIAHLSPHDLRRTCITELLTMGADALVVSRLAGHASVQTTMRYDLRPESAKRSAAGLLHMPAPPA